MSSDTYIVEALVRHNRYLDRVSSSVAGDVSDLLQELDRELRIRLEAADRIESPSANDLARARRDVAKLMRDLGVETVIEEAMRDLASSEVQWMESLFDEAIGTDTIIRTSPELVYSTLTDIPVTLTTTTGEVIRKTMIELVDDFTDSRQREVLRRIQLGIAAGDSNQEIARSVSRFLGNKSPRQAQALVRTLVTHVGNRSRKVAAIANKDLLEGEKFVATLDRRTTFICMRYDGKVFLVDQGPEPPLHYNCRSIRTPVVKSEFQLGDLRGERPYVGESTRGVVDSRVTSAGFLRQQPKTFQDDVLGPTRADLFRKNRVRLEDFTDDTGRTIPLNELRDKKGNLIYGS